MTDLVSYAFADGVATLTMDDGKANAMGPAMQAALNAALGRAEADKAIVLLTGRPGVFSGGFDLSVFKAGDPQVTFQMLTGGAMIALVGPFMDNTSATMVPAIALCALLAWVAAAASLPRLRLRLV